MARRKHHKSGRLPPFVPILYSMINHQAFRDLGYSSAKALLYFLAKVKVSPTDPARYSSPFSLTYPEARRYGFSNGTFNKVIRDLIDKGFIDPARKGGLRGNQKSSTLYCLSERWEKYGTNEFKEVDWGTFV